MKLGELDNSFGSINKNFLADSLGAQTNLQTHNGETQTFSNILKKSMVEVNNTQVNAYDAMEEIATGKVDNLQEAVKKIEEAELSLKLALEVKNKALGAYKQVMAMQI